MADKGRAAIYKGLGIPMEIKEYPVPDPEPGAIVVKVSVANICGSEMHMWRGDLNLGADGGTPADYPGPRGNGESSQTGGGNIHRFSRTAAERRRPGHLDVLLPLRALSGMSERTPRRMPHERLLHGTM